MFFLSLYPRGQQYRGVGGDERGYFAPEQKMSAMQSGLEISGFPDSNGYGDTDDTDRPYGQHNSQVV